MSILVYSLNDVSYELNTDTKELTAVYQSAAESSVPYAKQKTLTTKEVEDLLNAYESHKWFTLLQIGSKILGII